MDHIVYRDLACSELTGKSHQLRCSPRKLVEEGVKTNLEFFPINLAASGLSVATQNLILFTALASIGTSVYSGCKFVMNYAGKRVADWKGVNEQPAMEPVEVVLVIKRSMQNLKKLRKAVDQLLNCSAKEGSDPVLRKIFTDQSVELDDQLDRLQSEINKKGLPLDSPEKLSERTTKINELSRGFYQMIEPLNHTPEKILGQEIGGNRRETQAGLNIVTDFFKAISTLTP